MSYTKWRRLHDSVKWREKQLLQTWLHKETPNAFVVVDTPTQQSLQHELILYCMRAVGELGDSLDEF